MSYLHVQTRLQGDRPILHSQKNFGGGLNSDLPASDINVNELSNLENYIAFERYLRGRPGSVHVYDLPGSGQVQGIISVEVTVPSPKIVAIVQRGGKLYGGIVEITDFSGGSFGSVETRFYQYNSRGDLIAFNSSGIYYVTINYTTNRFFRVNLAMPTKLAPAQGSAGDQYKYKYLFTFSTIIKETLGTKATTGNRYTAGNILIHETPPAVIGSETDFAYWKELTKAAPINSSNPMVIPQAGLNAGAQSHVTHLSWYRTPDLGPNNLNNQYNDTFLWVGDQPIGDANFSDATTTDQLLGQFGNNRDPQNIGWSPLPTGDIGVVTSNFLFTATKGKNNLYYNQITRPELVGYYNAGVQYHTYDDAISVLDSTKDNLIVACKTKTHTISLTSYKNEGVLETLLVLDHFIVADEQIGVKDAGSWARVEEGVFASICSDKSVRLFDGGSWGKDLAIDKVGTVINEIREGVSQAIYYQGAYFLFFTRDGTATELDECLRLSLKRESGKGWTFYTGDDLVIPPMSSNSLVFLYKAASVNSGDLGVEFLFCVDKADNEGKLYWIETFDGPANKTIGPGFGYPIKRYYGDKVSSTSDGTDIICKVKGQEVTGSQESFNLIHSESHTYIRKVASSPKTLPDLLIDARAYVNGTLLSNESAGRIQYDGDIHFWYRVEGQRIAIEFIANRSGHDLTGFDTRFRVQDIARWTTRSDKTVDNTFQRDLQRGLVFWSATRPKKLVILDRKSQTKWSRNGIVTQTGPDGRSDALRVGVESGANPFTTVASTLFSDAFTIYFWIKDPNWVTDAVQPIKINGFGSNPALKISFLNSTTMRIHATNTVDVTVNDITGTTNTVNGYHQFILIRQAGSSDVNIYQNNTLIDTVTFADTFGGGNIELGGVG